MPGYRLMLSYLCGDDCIDLITFLATDKHLAIHDAFIQVWAGKALFRQVFAVFVRFMRDRHMSSRMPLLTTLLLAGFLALALRILVC